MEKKELDFYMSLKYEIRLQAIPEEEGGGFFAWIPDLGRVSCNGYGETPEEALEMLQEVKRSVIQSCIDRGLPIPEPATKKHEYSGKLLLRIPTTMHRGIAQIAEENNTSINSCIVQLLTKAMTTCTIQDHLHKAMEECFRNIKWPVQHHIHHATEDKGDYFDPEKAFSETA